MRLPHVAVPLGTVTGWNDTVPRLANLDSLGGLVGRFIPFERTRADREASRDPRPSIAETYRTKAVSLDRVRNAAEALVAQRFVRREDLEALLEDSARHGDVLMPLSPPSCLARALSGCGPRVLVPFDGGSGEDIPAGRARRRGRTPAHAGAGPRHGPGQHD